ncbi:MAG: hypothetical protein IKE70_03990 [Bacilli bacterium]|nr:hypothetical protein [Bacilli bacterium]
MDENNLEEQLSSIKESFQQGVIPESLINLINYKEDDVSQDIELLTDNDEDEDSSGNNTYTDDVSSSTSSSINLNTDDVDENELIDDLNEFF